MSPEKKIDQAAAVDYRQSHADKGADYDAWIAGSPFDAYMAKWEAYWLTQSLRRLYPHGIPRYLDFACGTGRIACTVAPLAKESTGVDISATMLDVARSKCAGVNFIEADLTQEHVGIGPFDVITTFRFLGNAQDELRDAALGTLAALLRPGGHLVINSHRNPLSIAALLHVATGGSHAMDLHYFKLKRLLARHGLQVVYARAIGFWLYRPLLLANWRVVDAPAILERAFSAPPFALFAPDVFVVARKRIA